GNGSVARRGCGKVDDRTPRERRNPGRDRGGRGSRCWDSGSERTCEPPRGWRGSVKKENVPGSSGRDGRDIRLSGGPQVRVGGCRPAEGEPRSVLGVRRRTLIHTLVGHFQTKKGGGG